MKKHTRSFTVDVKRPRFATAGTSAPSATWFTGLAEALHEPPVQVKAYVPEADPITSREERRVLPDLSPVKIWNEPEAAGLKAQAPQSADRIRVPQERRNRRRQEAVTTPEREIRVETPVQVPRVERKATPWRRLRAEDLPRGQRWKLRIPKSAW